MKRPLVWIALFFILGVILGQCSFYIKGFALFLILIFELFFFKKYKAFEIFLLAFMFLFGIIRISSVWNENAEEYRLNTDGEYAYSIQGVVVDCYEKENNFQSISLLTTRVYDEKEGFDCKIKLKIYLRDSQKAEIGDIISVKGSLEAFESPENPGAFNELLYYKARNFKYKMYAENPNFMGKSSYTFNSFLVDLRNRVCGVYDKTFPKTEAGIMKAMIVGEKGYIDDYVNYLYKQAGIAHILAISGLHVSVLTLMIFYLFSKILKLGKRVGSWVSLVFIIFYMVFTGFGAATVRAVIMASVMLFGNIIYRDYDKYNSVALAAMVLLIFNPLYIYDAGFLLSFISVLGILMGSEMINSEKSLAGLKKYFLSCFVASVVSMPVTAHFFYYISLVSVFTNMLVLPFVSIVTGIGFLTGILGLVSIKLSVFFGGIVFVILNFYELVCRILINIPYSRILTGRPSIYQSFSFYILFCAVYFLKYNYKLKKTIVFLLLFSNLFFIGADRFIFKKATVAFLDVGQGDGAVISTPEKYTFVIDAGGNTMNSFGQNTGVKKVIPYLQYSGLSEIDILFVTHMDWDHAFGAAELIENYKVNQIVISENFRENNEVFKLIVEKAEEKNIPIGYIYGGSKLSFGRQAEFRCIYPFKNGSYNFDENSNSLVLMFSYGDTSFLFTGDIDSECEEIISASGQDISADFLKVPHHGSKYSSSIEFLKMVNAKYSVISCGKNNVYMHPDEETLKRLYISGSKVYSTVKNGAVIVKTDGKNMEIKPMLGRD